MRFIGEEGEQEESIFDESEMKKKQVTKLMPIAKRMFRPKLNELMS
jgi:hypothetical protein